MEAHEALGDYTVLIIFWEKKKFSRILSPRVPLSRASLVPFCCMEDEILKDAGKSFAFPGQQKERFEHFFAALVGKSNEIMNIIITIIMTAVKY